MTGDIVEKDKMIAGKKSDIEVAGMVRMLMRDDLNHEFVCVAGRDRIMYLSQQLEKAKEKLEIVRQVARGERQVADDDTEGMTWIAEFIDEQ